MSKGTTFSRVIVSLREDFRYTQQQVADQAGCSKTTISQYESGVQPSAVMMGRLAEVFRLNQMERATFYLIGIEPDVKNTGGNEYEKESIEKAVRLRDAILGKIEKYRVPAFILDGYGDVIAINGCCYSFLSPPPELLAQAHEFAAGRNILRYIFDAKSGFRELLGTPEQWERAAIQNIAAWRYRTLRQRGSDAYKAIFARLSKKDYDPFLRYWEKVLYAPPEIATLSNRYFEVKHGDVQANYYTETSFITTGYRGEQLGQVLYIPVDQATVKLFDDLCGPAYGSNRVPDVFRVNPLWPGKKPHLSK